MKVAILRPCVTDKVEFNLRSWKFVPQHPGCYVLSTFDGEVLYVGLSNNLYRRFSQHRDAKEKTEPTKWGLAFWFHYIIANEREIEGIERGWINQHLSVHGAYPPLNKVHSPVR